MPSRDARSTRRRLPPTALPSLTRPFYAVHRRRKADGDHGSTGWDHAATQPHHSHPNACSRCWCFPGSCLTHHRHRARGRRGWHGDRHIRSVRHKPQRRRRLRSRGVLSRPHQGEHACCVICSRSTCYILPQYTLDFHTLHTEKREQAGFCHICLLGCTFRHVMRQGAFTHKQTWVKALRAKTTANGQECVPWAEECLLWLSS